METTHRLLLQLLGRALFGAEVSLPAETDWLALSKEARSHSVHLLVFDCLTEAEQTQLPPQVAAAWQREAFLTLQKNERIRHEQQEILRLFSREKIPCLILKGSSSAMCYPRPDLRCAGDIDLLIPPQKLDQGIALLRSKGYGEPINYDHPIHRTQLNGEFCVELHFRMPCIPDTPIGAELRSCFFSTALENRMFENGLPILPDNQQALLLLLHKLRHITSSGMGLRQLCDWAAFVHRKLTPELWAELHPVLDRFGLMHFTCVITRICVEYLALPAEDAPWCMIKNEALAAQLLEDILRTGNFGCKENRYGQRLFTDGQSGGRLSSFLRTAVKTSYEHWPICKKYPVLLPLAPAALLLRYRKQRKAGERPPFRPIAVYRGAKSRQALYQSLQAFAAEKEN